MNLDMNHYCTVHERLLFSKGFLRFIVTQHVRPDQRDFLRRPNRDGKARMEAASLGAHNALDIRKHLALRSGNHPGQLFHDYCRGIFGFVLYNHEVRQIVKLLKNNAAIEYKSNDDVSREVWRYTGL